MPINNWAAVPILIALFLLAAILPSTGVYLVMDWQASRRTTDRQYGYQVNDLVHSEIESLQDFLLSGNIDDVTKIAKVHRELQQAVDRRLNQKVTVDDSMQSAHLKVNEQLWYDQVAVPSINARSKVNNGKMNVNEMVMTYLTQDPFTVVDRINGDLQDIRRAIESQ